MINTKTLNSINDTCIGVFINESIIVLQLDVSEVHYKYVEIDLAKDFQHLVLSEIRETRFDIDEPYFGYQRHSKESAIQYISDFSTNENLNKKCIEETLQIIRQLNF
ncbi:MAG: hypothetical protein WCP69_03275 [Bacteroidota bacterium]